MKEHEKWWEARLKDPELLKRFHGGLADVFRLYLKEHLRITGYETILDCAAGPCKDGENLKGTGIDYFAIDITPLLVKDSKSRGFNIKQSSIEDIVYNDNEFDICYGRHILEHLEYYEKAISEMVRVAKKEIMIIFFRPPHDDPDICVLKRDLSGKLYHGVYDKAEIAKQKKQIGSDYYFQNAYNKIKMEKFIIGLTGVKEIRWVNDNYILHVLLGEIC